MKKILIPVFPGTNCENETKFWVHDNLECAAEFLELEKHTSLERDDVAAIIIPGGFSYGDYLRAGAIASRSPELKFIKKMAEKEVPVLGICNGFQILCESGLLPGVLIKNITRQHHHFPVAVKINPDFLISRNGKQKCAWLPGFSENELHFVQHEFTDFLLPMSCGMGNWLPPQNEQQNTEKNTLVSYVNNENGSYKSIAGITNDNGNILGMMPHPERASDPLLGNIMGLIFLYGLYQSQNIKIRANSPLSIFVQKLNKREHLYV